MYIAAQQSNKFLNFHRFVNFELNGFTSSRKFKKRATFAAISIVVFVLFGLETFYASQAQAANGIRKTINFQGKLVNPNGTNVADGEYDITFKIYTVSSGGAAVWTEEWTSSNDVTVRAGIFQVELGSLTSLPGSVNFGTDNIYLGITVEADSEMSPRIRFTSVPQAFNAEKVNGLTVTNTSDNPFSSTTTLKIADGKTVVVNNGLTFSGTDSTTFTFPTSTGTVVTEDFAQTLTNKVIGSTGLTFTGATTDLTTSSNQDFVLTPNGSGKIGFNTTSPLSTLDVRANSVAGGTLAVASVSGTTSFAALVVDNGGLGDIFAASTSGVTKFAVKNNGQLYVANYQNDGGIFYTTTSGIISQTAGGDEGECLTFTGGLPAWGACSDATGSSNWVLSTANGTISPINNTLDFLIGSTASTSAEFSVLGIAAGSNPSASVSATTGSNLGNGTAMFGDGSLQSLSRNTLTIGGGTTGNIILNAGSDLITLSDNTSLAGNLAFTSTGNITFAGGVLSDGTDEVDISDDLAVSGVIQAGHTAAAAYNRLGTDTAGGSNVGANNDLLVSGALEVNDLIYADGGIDTAFTSNGGILYTNGSGVVAQVTAGSDTQCLLGGTSPSFGSCATGIDQSKWVLSTANGTISPINNTLDLLLGATATTSAKFSVLNIAGDLTPVASVSATTGANANKGIYLSGDGSLQSVRKNTLTIGGSDTGFINLDSGSSLITFSDPTIATSTLAVNGNITLGDLNTADTLTGNLLSSSITSGATTQTALSLAGTGFTTGNIFDVTGTFNGSTTSHEAIDINLTRSSGDSTDFTGINLVLDHSSAVTETVYGTASTVNLTGNAARTAYGLSGAVTSSSNTADSIVGVQGTATHTGDISSGASAQYGGYFVGTSNSDSTGGTLVVVGLGAQANGTTTDGGATILGAGITVLNGTFNTTGTTAQTGIHINPINGADTNVGLCFDCADGVWSQSDVGAGIQFGADANSVNLYRSASDTLRTDDALSINGNAQISTAGVLSGLTGLTLSSGAITLGGSTGSGQCITGGATAAWGSCGSGGGSSNWVLSTANGTLSPINNTLDLLWGGTSTGSANFRVNGKNALSGTQVAASVSANTSFAGLVVDNRGVGDILAASSSGMTRFVVKQSGVVQIGNDTDGLTFDYLNGGPIYSGQARPTKRITLSPEYAGAVLTASGSSTITGSLTSDASHSAEFRTFYEWSSTQNVLQDYTVAVRVTLPKDFSSWTTGNTMTINYNNGDNAATANKLDVFMYLVGDTSGNPIYHSTGNVTGTDKTWTTLNLTAGLLDNNDSTDWDAADEQAIIYLKMYATGTYNYTQIGDIVLNYLSKF